MKIKNKLLSFLSFCFSLFLVYTLSAIRYPLSYVYAQPKEGAAMLEEEALFVARRAMEDNFYDLALTLLGRFTDKFPESLLRKDAEFYMGQCYFYQKKYSSALAQFKKLSEDFKDSPARDKFYYWTAEVYFKSGDFSLARDFYEKLIFQYPESVYVAYSFYSVGWCLFGEGKFQEAQKEFNKFRKKFPQNALAEEAAFKIIECLYNLKNYFGLREYLKIFGREYPQTSKSAYLEFYLAESDFYTGDYRSAIVNYTKSLEREVSDKNLSVLIYLGLGYGYLKSNDFINARSNFDKAIGASRDKKNTESALLGKAAILMSTSLFKDAVFEYSDLLAKKPDETAAAEAYLGKAEALYNLGDYESSLLTYREAREVIDKSLLVLPVLSEGFTEEKDKSLTVSGRNLTAIGKDDGREYRADRFNYGLALVYLKLGNFESASEEISLLVARSKNIELKVSCLIRKADAYLEARDIEKAKQVYESVLKDYPESSSGDYARYSLGLCFFNLKQYTRAVGIFKEVINDYPESKVLEDARFYLASAYFENADFVNSARELDGWVFLYPQSKLSARAFLLKGLSLKSLGRFQDAEDAFKLVLRSSGFDARLIARAEFEAVDCLYYAGRLKEAVGKFDFLRSKYADSEISGNILWRLAEYYFKENNFDLCGRYLLGIIKGYPQSDLLNDAHYMLGLCFEKQKLYREALEEFNKVKGKEDDVLPRIAGVYRVLGDYSNAVLYYRMSLSREKVDKPLIHFTLAEFLEESGNLSEAVSEYSKIDKNSNQFLRALLRRAQIAEGEEDWAKAMALYEQSKFASAEEARFAEDRIEIIKERYLTRNLQWK